MKESSSEGFFFFTYEEFSLASKLELLWLAALRGRRGEARELVEEEACSSEGTLDEAAKCSRISGATRAPRISGLCQIPKQNHITSTASTASLS